MLVAIYLLMVILKDLNYQSQYNIQKPRCQAKVTDTI